MTDIAGGTVKPEFIVMRTLNVDVIRSKRTTVAVFALLTLFNTAAFADRKDNGHHDNNRRSDHYDNRYNHDRYYPQRGHYVPYIPRDRVVVRYRGGPYYFHGGAWYRPYGSRFIVIAPPIGIGIPFLPPFYTTVWFNGSPYYYADDTYYAWRPDRSAYVVTNPPADADSATTMAPGSDELFVYPKKGQSEEELAADRYECHSWAVRQTGFDPTQPQGGVDNAQAASKRADYQRAQGACLEARGYSVK